MSDAERPKRDELPIACNPTALDAEQRERKRLLQQQLRADVWEIRELPDGYAFRHSSESSMCLVVAEFIALERLCCPFLDFGFDVERDGGPLWFRMTGGKEAKRVLQANLGLA